MNNRYERNQERGDARRNSGGMIWLFGQMMMLPLTVFAYGMELFVKTVQGRQGASDDGMDMTAGRRTTRLPDDYTPERGESTSNSMTSVNDGTAGDAAQTITKETNDMNDRDLSDSDMLKLVRYKILFIKRDYEHAFPEVEELVSEDMDETAYTAWKVAEFIQRLGKRKTEIPDKWGTYPDKKDKNDKYVYRDGNILLGFPEEDKKYLRVYYEVLDRYPRERFKHNEEQIKVLKEIRDRIKV